MMNSAEPRYATAASFRRALDERLKTKAKERGRPVNEVRREFLFQRFLGMVFAEPGEAWVLKGGAGLLMRLTTARYSQDLDLLRSDSADVRHSVDELHRLTRPKPGDHLTFIVGDAVSYSPSNPVVRIKVRVAIGADYDQFTIDLAHNLHMVATPERVTPTPVVVMPGLPELPEITVYPLVDQVADKLCAMYEQHGGTGIPSSRFRDLHDLVLILQTYELDANLLSQAVASEAARRKLRLPAQIKSPGPQWAAGYRRLAQRTELGTELHDLNNALNAVGRCLNPIIDGSRVTGRWSSSEWRD